MYVATRGIKELQLAIPMESDLIMQKNMYWGELKK
jgi:hypothetical protein